MLFFKPKLSRKTYCSERPMTVKYGVVSFMQRFWEHRLWISKHWFFSTICAECNGSNTSVPLSFMLSKILVTKPLYSANQNYFVRAVRSGCIDLDSCTFSITKRIFQSQSAHWLKNPFFSKKVLISHSIKNNLRY